MAALTYALINEDGDDDDGGGDGSSSSNNNNNGENMVVVLSDRLVLDEQLARVISQYLGGKGVCTQQVLKKCSGIDKTDSLAHALADRRCRVVVTTLQTFRTQAYEVKKVARRRVAVVADEAHRGHNSATAAVLEESLAKAGVTSLAYFCFTATPGQATLTQFGQLQGNVLRPFHVYSLRDAEADGLTLPLLDDYTCISPRVSLHRTEDGRGGEGADCKSRKLDVSSHLHRAASMSASLRAKAAYIAEHHVKRLANGLYTAFPEARSLVVCCSRYAVLRMRRALVREFKRLREEKSKLAGAVPMDVALPADSVYAAFSGTLAVTPAQGALDEEDGYDDGDNESDAEVPNKTLVNESDVNGILNFRDARFLIVCGKYETGYDDYRLVTLYLDRPVAGSRAVQVCGRIGRKPPTGAGSKPTPCVVDFANDIDTIYDSFVVFYDEAELHTDGDNSGNKERSAFEGALRHVLAALSSAGAAATHGASIGGALNLTPTEAARWTAVARGAHDELETPGDDGGAARAQAAVADYISACLALRCQAPELPLSWARAYRDALKDELARAQQSGATSARLPRGWCARVDSMDVTWTGAVSLRERLGGVSLPTIPLGRSAGGGASTSSKLSLGAASQQMLTSLSSSSSAPLLALADAISRAAEQGAAPQHALALLRRAAMRRVTTEDLVSTRLAFAVKRLRRAHTDTNVIASASALLRTWRALVDAVGEGQAAEDQKIVAFLASSLGASGGKDARVHAAAQRLHAALPARDPKDAKAHARALATFLKSDESMRERVIDGGSEVASSAVAEALGYGKRKRAAAEAAQKDDDAMVPGGTDCARCGGVRCVEEVTMNGGGTYAQERELLQKAVCRMCGHTSVV